MKVLIADDMLSSRMFIADLIQSLGHTSIPVKDGREAVNYLETNKVDAIILDIEMPNMNGLETATHIKDILKINTPIASFTSHDSNDYLQRMKNAGFDHCLLKNPKIIDNIKNFLVDIPVN
ncbi:MAG: response regulator [Bacteroidota bacterium]